MSQNERTEAEQAILDQAAEIHDEKWVAENEIVILAQARLAGEFRSEPTSDDGPSRQPVQS